MKNTVRSGLRGRYGRWLIPALAFLIVGAISPFLVADVSVATRPDAAIASASSVSLPVAGADGLQAGTQDLAVVSDASISTRRPSAFGPPSDSRGWRGGVPILPGERPTNHGAVDWINVNPSVGPTGRGYMPMTYAERADRSVPSLPLVIALHVSAQEAAWTPSPTAAPSPRLAPGMAYDSGSDRTILFGGFTEERVFLGDTWAFDLVNNIWTSMDPSAAPQARGDPGFAYDRDSDRVLLFGGVMKLDGETSYVDLNDTWAYDFNTNTWQNLSPAAAPSPRHGHKVAYDTESHRMIMVGGHTCSYDALPKVCPLFGDTWAYDYGNNTWTNMILVTGPSTPNFHGFAYDGESDRAVLYGGDGSTAQETWAYDFNANTWTRLNPQQNPGSLSFLAMAYDAESDRVILFGGFTAGVRSADTWAYDLNPNTWTRMSAGVKPSARQDHAMAYDAQSDRVVLFGGCAGFESQCNNETWAYDFDTNMWIPLTRPSAPRTLAAMSGNSRVDLSWLPPGSTGGSPITNYRIYRGTASGILTLLVEVGSVLSYTDITVTNGVTYYYTVSAVTAAGEGEPSIEDFTTPLATPDTVNPVIAIVSPADGATLASTIAAISGTAADNVGIERVELSTDGTNWVLATGTTSWTGTLTLSEGPNAIHARATDTSGNVDSANISVTVPPPPPPPWPFVLGSLAAVSVGTIIGALLWRRRKVRRIPPRE